MQQQLKRSENGLASLSRDTSAELYLLEACGVVLPVTDGDIEEMIPMLSMRGLTGHIPLFTYFRDRHPQFFDRAIGPGDHKGVVIEILRMMRGWLQDEGRIPVSPSAASSSTIQPVKQH